MPVLITNNSNTHPPEAWAVATAQMIFDVGADVASNRRIPALKLQTAIAESLVAHYSAVQADEQAKIDADPAHLHTPHETAQYLDQAVSGIQALAADTPWADNFVEPAMAARIRSVIGDHFATAQNVHRQAHAVANPDHPDSQGFMGRLHGWIGGL